MNERGDAPVPPSRDQALALAMAVAFRTGAYYGADNAVLQQACASLHSHLAERLSASDSVSVGVHSHCVFIDRARIRTTVSSYGRFSYLIHLFETWGLAVVTFTAGLTADELIKFVLAVSQVGPGGPTDLADKLLALGVHNVQVEIGAPAPVSSAPTVYAAALQAGREIQDAVESGDQIDVRRLRRVTQAVIDEVMADEQSMLTLTTIKKFDEYLLSHSTNVAILSVLLGQHLGLSKGRLSELCLAGFVHDIGKVDVAPSVLHKEGPLDSDEWEDMRLHPVYAARTLLGVSRPSPSIMRAVVVAFEHHLDYDMTGYPKTELKDTVTLFGNIVTIADRYDAMTTARVYRKNLTPYEALHYLIDRAGTVCDPVLIKLFVDIMGLYPPGTMVELTNGETGVVCEPPAVGRPLEKPKVRIVKGTRPGRVLDLDMRVEGRQPLDIVRVLNPNNMGQVPAVDAAVFDRAV
ncbi:MAG: HD domain-containing protein [Thermoleophilia bacterium]|nr:HD domain-containing protein [Thermoleophilia bacterium]